ncbi:MAG: DUF3782 domain-containing protein [Candidatus Nitrosothermus koennekii]|nr:MAG: DUF3782 domain-containing protein [Candidatus Nitrosothermus koennekii]
MQINDLKKNIIELLEKDKEFRYTIAGLIGYKELLDRIVKLDERLVKVEERLVKLEERVTKFEERITERIVKLEERVVKVEEMLASFEKRITDRIVKVEERFADVNERLVKLEERVVNVEERLVEDSKILQEHTNILKEHSKMLQEFKVGFGSIGRRAGKGLEKLILNIYKEQLEQLGIDPSKARRYEYIDYEGKYGLKGKRYEFDIVISNNHVDILEVKNHVDEDDIISFYEKVNAIRELLIKEFNNINRLIVVAVDIDEEALMKARDLDIKTVYGYVIPPIE